MNSKQFALEGATWRIPDRLTLRIVQASGANADGDTWATDVKREGEVTSAEAAREAADA